MCSVWEEQHTHSSVFEWLCSSGSVLCPSPGSSTQRDTACWKVSMHFVKKKKNNRQRENWTRLLISHRASGSKQTSVATGSALLLPAPAQLHLCAKWRPWSGLWWGTSVAVSASPGSCAVYFLLMFWLKVIALDVIAMQYHCSIEFKTPLSSISLFGGKYIYLLLSSKMSNLFTFFCLTKKIVMKHYSFALLLSYWNIIFS